MEDPYEAPPDPPPLDQAALDALAADIDAALDSIAGATHSVLMVGADTGQIVYQRAPDSLLKPASNTKLFTTAAAMRTLGEEHRLRATVYATEDPSDGVVNGELVLVGEHDFTLTSRYYVAPSFPLETIADELAALGLAQVTGSVRAQGEFVYEGNSVGTYNAAAHRTAVANAFRSALVGSGVTVGGAAATAASFDPPAGATALFAWESLPLTVGAFTINVVSHNEFADALSRHLGWLQLGESSYAAGFAEIGAALADLGVDATGLDLNDGSGLSHDNRVSARHIVQLFEAMRGQPEGLSWWRTFSVAGMWGTLANRMGGPDTLGRFAGKTGTLTGVVALSGVLDHRYDGQRYFASMLMNSVPNSTAARAALDDVVEALAGDHRQLGPRPAAPRLGCVKNDANGVTVLANWSEVPDAGGYLVWRSADGKVWDRGEARLVTKTSHRTLPLEGASKIFIRITAVGAAGESDPSDVYAAAVGDDPSTLLLVDGNDRWQAEPAPDNVTARNHDFSAVTARAVDARAFDSCDNDALLAGEVALSPYGAVVWSLGNESTDDETFDSMEQQLVRSYVDDGGSLLVSGAEIGWDLDEQGSAEDQAFLSEVLRAAYLGDDAATITLRGLDALDGFGFGSFYNPGLEGVDFPDALAPARGSTVVVEYVGGTGGAAGLVTAIGAQRIVVLGFPLETVDTEEHRAALLSLALDG